MKSDIDKNLSPLSIRKLDLEKDLPLLYEWMKAEYVSADRQSDFKYAGLLDSYKFMEKASFAEACMLYQADETPVMEVDLCEGVMDEIYPFYEAQPSDYTIRLQFPPQRDLQLIESGLQLICHYCFTQKEAKTLIAPVYARDDFQKSLFTDLGFSCYSKNLYKKIYSLYILAR